MNPFLRVWRKQHEYWRTARDRGSAYPHSATTWGAITSGPRWTAKEGTGPGLKSRTDTIPFLGRKYALLAQTADGWMFEPLTAGGYVWPDLLRNDMRYGLTAYARCANGYAHLDDHGPVPSVLCSCGFYARSMSARQRQPLIVQGSSWVVAAVELEVMLAGRVIVHEHGFRAEFQQVLAVRFPDECPFCHIRHVTWGNPGKPPMMWPRWEDDEDLRAHPLPRMIGDRVSTICERCARDMRDWAHGSLKSVGEPADVMAIERSLGIPVTFGSP